MNNTGWILPEQTQATVQLSLDLGLPLALAQILVNRNIEDEETAHRFLYGSLDDLHDPTLMRGMDQAVIRIKQAITDGEKILIFGDYDVDGILSVVMLTKALKSMGAVVEHYIPERLEEGYGLKARHVDVVMKRGARLVISVDCGIKAVDFVNEMKNRGRDVIITDHHQPGPRLPEAVAVLNPVIEGSGYPDKALASVGVAFKMIQALLSGTPAEDKVTHYLKLVAIGTVADVASLRGENRIFVKYGLEGLKNVSNKGLRGLMRAASVDGDKVTAGDIGFRIGPRINAAGRMGQTEQAVRLFFSESDEERAELISSLERLNSWRQKVEGRILDQAQQRILDRSLASRYKILVLGCEDWHRGVIGIVASKLKDIFYRPILLFAYEDGKAVGSGRSIRGFSLIDCLEDSRRFFSNYGGHTLAVGCELPVEKMEDLRRAFNAYAERNLPDDLMKRKLRIDAKIDLAELNDEFLEKLELLSPFGMGNPRPLFLTEEASVIADPRILKKKHTKLVLKQGGRVLEALGWGRPEWAEQTERGDRIALVFGLQTSTYLGQEKLSLVIEDLRKG